MTGNEYLAIIRARELDTRNRVTTATSLRQSYTSAAGNYAQTHGQRPSGFLGLFSPSRSGWDMFDRYWAATMSGSFEQLRIALNRAIEGIGLARRVTGPSPAETQTLLPQLGMQLDRGREVLNWYLESPVSRHDPRRPAQEQTIRLLMSRYPDLLETMQAGGISERTGTTNIMDAAGIARPPDPEITLARQSKPQDEYAEAQASGLTPATDSDIIRARAAMASAGKDLSETVPEWAASAAEATSRGTRTLYHLLGPAGGRHRRPGGGMTFGDGLALIGVGSLVVGGIYLYVKTRPSVAAASTAMRYARGPKLETPRLPARRNPEDCG